MEIHELKNSLAKLVLNDLDLLGIDLDDLDKNDNIHLYTTTDETCEALKEATWISSVNQEDVRFITITQGTIYDEKSKEETGKDFEVGRILVDEVKAEMIIDALYHAYPDLIHSKIDEIMEEEEEEGAQKDLTASEIDNIIGMYRREIHNLELKKKNKTPEKVDSDNLIDAYKRVKRYAAKLNELEAEPKVVKRKNSVVFVSGFKDKKMIKVVEANVEEIARQKIKGLPGRKVSKCLLIDKKLAKVIAEKFKVTF